MRSDGRDFRRFRFAPGRARGNEIMNEYQEIPLNQIETKSNYRLTFNDITLKELARSIKENGVIEPIIVRKNGNGFQVIAGERRLRASHIAKLGTIPAIVKDVSDKDFLRLQLIENIQRENVPYMEEAYGIRDLRDKCDLDLSELATIIGKTAEYVDYMIKLTEMSAGAQEAARRGELSKTVAVQIARLNSHEYQEQAARDLRRTRRGDLISTSGARKYIQRNFRDTGLLPSRKQNHFQKENGNDFKANWKKYLVHFTSEEFERWKAIVHGRTHTEVLAEAVDVVMRENLVNLSNNPNGSQDLVHI